MSQIVIHAFQTVISIALLLGKYGGTVLELLLHPLMEPFTKFAGSFMS